MEVTEGAIDQTDASAPDVCPEDESKVVLTNSLKSNPSNLGRKQFKS